MSAPVTLAGLLADLDAETTAVGELLADLTPAGWERPTPAAGWAIRDQVSHLAFFDEAAVLAATDPERFRAETAELVGSGPGFADEVARRYRHLTPERLAGWFRTARHDLLDVFGALDPKARVPWYGPDMSVISSVTARLMETWAHGQDIADSLGVQRKPTDRLRHVVHLGVRTFGFSFQLRGRDVPSGEVKVELAAASGATWSWGPQDAADLVAGPALDFCLVVTQRRHVADTALRIQGPVAAEWMEIAQAFAGPPGPGRAPGKSGRRTA